MVIRDISLTLMSHWSAMSKAAFIRLRLETPSRTAGTLSSTSWDMEATQPFGWPGIHRKSEQSPKFASKLFQMTDPEMLLTREWVSIKIKQAHCSVPLHEDADIKAYTILENGFQSEPQSESRCFPRYIDSFKHSGPNGAHTCIVTELLGPTISFENKEFNKYGLDEGRAYRPDTILRASRQLLEAIDTIHRYGIAHGGW